MTTAAPQANRAVGDAGPMRDGSADGDDSTAYTNTGTLRATARASSSSVPNPGMSPPEVRASMSGVIAGEGGGGAVAANAAAAAEMPDRAGSVVAREDGMRREWNFTLTFRHEAARLALQCSPHWEPTFIDPETIENITKLDRDVVQCPLMPVLRYTDLSAVVTTANTGSANRGNNVTNTAGTRTSVGSLPLNNTLNNTNSGYIVSPNDGDRSSVSLGMTLAEGEAGEWWVEKAKHVEGWYAHLAPATTLASFCHACVQHVLKDPLVVSIDGDNHLTTLRMGRKLACPVLLAGRHHSFHFRFRLQDRSQLMNDAAYAIGTVVNQRGYLFLVRCSEEEELEGYLSRLFLPYYASPAKLSLDADIGYHAVTSGMLADQQGLYGEILYEDRDAAVAFSLPMYPMRIRPDFSPAKTVGVGSIACMTLELGVFERVFEDAAVAEVTGMAKYKVNQVVLCLDVEDVARMGYPNVLSTDQYCERKMKRLLEVFPDANLVGQQPTTVQLGGKAGRSYTATFSYEPMQCIAKAMLVTTLIDGYGVTALYLTRLGGGSFDAYLYIYEQLLAATRFLPHSSQQASLRLSRHRAPNVRLLDTDLAMVYGGGRSPVPLRPTAAAAEDVGGETPQKSVKPSPAGVAQAAPTNAKAGGEEEGESGTAATTAPQDAAGAVAAAAPQDERADGEVDHAANAAPGVTTADVVKTLYGRVKRNKVLEKHLRLMREAASDGRIPEGAVVLQVPQEQGGLPRHRNNSATPAAATNAASGAGPGAAGQGAALAASVTSIGATNAGPRSARPSTKSTALPLSPPRPIAIATAPIPPPPADARRATTDLHAAAGNSLHSFGTAGSTTAMAHGGGTAFSPGGSTAGLGSAAAAAATASAAVDSLGATESGHIDMAEVSLHSDSLINIEGIPRLEEMRRQADALAAETAVAGHRGDEDSATTSPTGPRLTPTAMGVNGSRRSSRRLSANSNSHATNASSVFEGMSPSSASAGAPDPGPFRDPAPDSEDTMQEGGGTPLMRDADADGVSNGDAEDGTRETPERQATAHSAPVVTQEESPEAIKAAADEARIRQILEAPSATTARSSFAGAAGTGEQGGGATTTTTTTTTTTYVIGPSLRDVYVRCCDLQHCKPNSYLLKKLPTDPQFTHSVEEIDLTANYLGRNGFAAVLNLLEHLPRLQHVFFNDMSLDNADVEHMCEALSRHPTVTTVEVKNNAKITLPATRFFTRLLRANPNIHRLCLDGTRIGEGVIGKLEQEAARNKLAGQQSQRQREQPGEEEL